MNYLEQWVASLLRETMCISYKELQLLAIGETFRSKGAIW
jgi:hypothetical protein